LALLELDGYQRINEHHGGSGGERILIELGRLLGGRVRRHDIVVRYGEDQFALLLSACGVEAARGLLERLLALIRDWEPALEDGSRVRITVSAGIATYPDTGLVDCDSVETLLQAAEHALRVAGSRGGGRLAIYGE
ncbi:GGDEF domain-containing protein, partial [Arthrospira platensis SPKY1]|nr:GGDEF domain-containing protein [Arthrospira platensis SPKY1]